MTEGGACTCIAGVSVCWFGAYVVRALAPYIHIDANVAYLVPDRPAGVRGNVADAGTDLLGGAGGGGDRALDPLLIIFHVT